MADNSTSINGHFISSSELFNFLQDSTASKLVMDVRSHDKYLESSIRSSQNLTFTSTPTTTQNLHITSADDNIGACKKYAWDDKECSIKDSKDWNLRGVVYKWIFFIDEQPTDQGVTWNIIRLLKEEKKVNPQCIKVLKDGFASFASDYPFLISSFNSQKRALDGILASEIVPKFLYLGSYENASSSPQLKALGITHILNMAGELENKFPNDGYFYKKCGIDDHHTENIATHFKDALDFIDNAASENPNNKVLVHCAMGISRSSAIVIAWIMQKKGWSFEASRDWVKLKRPVIKPNEGFLQQLKEFDVYLQQTRTQV